MEGQNISSNCNNMKMWLASIIIIIWINTKDKYKRIKEIISSIK